MIHVTQLFTKLSLNRFKYSFMLEKRAYQALLVYTYASDVIWPIWVIGL